MNIIYLKYKFNFIFDSNMESKLINKINQNYTGILNIMKLFLKDNFNTAEKNSENYNSFEDDILKKKYNEIEKYIQEYSYDNNKLLDKMDNLKKTVNNLIKEILDDKQKIINNTNESLYLVKHPQDCLFLLQIDNYNNNIYNYLNMIDYQINTHKYDKLETIYFILCNMKINSK